MGKYGKWIGGTLGWAFGGPVGAVLGFAFGSMIDGAQTVETNGDVYKTTQRGDFTASLMVLAAAVMKADGKIMKSELDYVKNFFLSQFGLQVTEDNMLKLREILKQDFPLNDVCYQIKYNMDYSIRLQLLHFLFGIAGADGQFHSSEIRVIEDIASFMDIHLSDFNSIKAMFVKETDSAYKILEISPDATDDEVKKAYRQMAIKYHPDKVSTLGEDVQKAANEKFQQLNNAYEQIKKQRGMN